MSEWVSVKDRLPERPEPKNPGCFVVSENYLVYEPDVGVYTAFYMFGSSRRNFYYRDTDHPRKGVTHWMPLPEPPEESEV